MKTSTLIESLLQKITALELLIEKQSAVIEAQALKIEEQALTIERLHFIPEDRLQQLFGDLYDIRLAINRP